MSWLPFYHDMGLMLGVLAPLVAERGAVLTSPLAFLSKPASWMQLIASHPGAFSAGPNFTVDLAVRRISDEDIARLDVGNVVAVSNGAVDVSHAAIQGITERSPGSVSGEGGAPSYGPAEATNHVVGLHWPADEDCSLRPREASAGVPSPARTAGGTTELVSLGAPRHAWSARSSRRAEQPGGRR